MNKPILLAAALLAYAGLSSPVNAATVTTNLGAGASYTLSDVSLAGNVDLNSEAVTTTFMSDHVVSGVNFTLFNAQIVAGDSPSGAYAKPDALADTDHYIAVRGNNGIPGLSGISFFALNLGTTTFGFDWGTIDSYNSLSYTNGNNQTHTISGGDLISLLSTSPTHLYNGDTYFTLTDLAGIRSLILSSTSDSFEAGNFMVASVPLPAALPLFGAGLVGLAALRRRKMKTA